MDRKIKILNVSLNGALLMARHAKLQEEGYEVFSVSTWEEFERACALGGSDLLILGHTLKPSSKNDMWQFTMKHCPATKVVELYLHAPSLPLPSGQSFNVNEASLDELVQFVGRDLNPKVYRLRK